MRKVLLAAAATLLAGAASGAPVSVTKATDVESDALVRLPMRVVGRVARDGAMLRRQWPGTYFQTAFRGRRAFLRIGAGEVALRVSVDGSAGIPLVRPAPGLYRVGGLVGGEHRLRVDVASESQAEPTEFGGFFAARGTSAAALPQVRRRIEFIGDSHTVGYGNSAPKQDCSQAEVWETTDGTRGIAPLVSARYGADYRVNAISGRGIVRNYGGFAADTLPQAYPHALLDNGVEADEAGWRPQVIVIALGTNDFSTPLQPGERWTTRDQLHADYENTYVAFLKSLRRRNPKAIIVLWATDLADGEIAAEESRVARRMQGEGDARIRFVLVPHLGFTGCHSHPGLADDRTIAAAIAGMIDREPGVWRR